MERYTAALTQELFVLERLLERHQCSHGRAIYYRRISMVVQSARKYNLLSILENQWKTLDQATVDYCQRRKRKRTEVQWDLRGAILTEEQRSIHEDFEILQSLLTDGVQELISRIQHASTILFLEVSRGFFLPFCTVALSALARTRTLLLRIGRLGLSKLQSILTEQALYEFVSIDKTRVETCMSRYIDEDKDRKEAATGGWISIDERRGELLQSLGYTVATKPRNNQGKEATSRSNQGQKAQKNRTGGNDHDVDDPESYSIEPGDIQLRGAKEVGKLTSVLSPGDDDLGESLDVSCNTDVADIQSKATAASVYRVADPVDRNMEILETMSRGKENRSSTRRVGPSSPKPPRKREEEKKGKKMKQKTKSSADFFDELFG